MDLRELDDRADQVAGLTPSPRPAPMKTLPAPPLPGSSLRPELAGARTARTAEGRRRGHRRDLVLVAAAPGAAADGSAMLTAAAATSIGSNSSASDSTTTRYASNPPASSDSRRDARVSSSRFARRSATVGTLPISIFCFVARSMFFSMPVLARLGERDRDALAPRAPRAADPVDVRRPATTGTS